LGGALECGMGNRVRYLRHQAGGCPGVTDILPRWGNFSSKFAMCYRSWHKNILITK